MQNKGRAHSRGEYNVYSTFQSHEPEFDYLKSLEIEEKINKIRWLPQQNAAHFLLSTNGENCKRLFDLIFKSSVHGFLFQIILRVVSALNFGEDELSAKVKTIARKFKFCTQKKCCFVYLSVSLVFVCV